MISIKTIKYLCRPVKRYARAITQHQMHCSNTKSCSQKKHLTKQNYDLEAVLKGCRDLLDFKKAQDPFIF